MVTMISTERSREFKKALGPRFGKLFKFDSSINWTEFPSAWTTSDKKYDYPIPGITTLILCDIILCDDPSETLSTLPGTHLSWFGSSNGLTVDVVVLKVLLGDTILFINLPLHDDMLPSTFDKWFQWL